MILRYSRMDLEANQKNFVVAKDGRVQGFVPSLALTPKARLFFVSGAGPGLSARGSPFVLIVSLLGWCGASHDTILRPP